MDTPSRSRDALRPRYAGNFPPSLRGRSEDRVRAAPAISRADCAKQNAHEHTGSAESIRPSLRNGFTAYIVLSPENGSFASVAPEKRLPPGNLTPAPRRQDHTTSPYASVALVCRNPSVHRIPPHVRDDHDPPLLTGETGRFIALISTSDKAKHFRFWA